MLTKITLEGGKYVVQHKNGAEFEAFRHGEKWRDLTGDGLVLALVQRIGALQDTVDGEILREIGKELEYVEYLGNYAEGIRVLKRQVADLPVAAENNEKRLEWVYQTAMKPFITPIMTKAQWLEKLDAEIVKLQSPAGGGV